MSPPTLRLSMQLAPNLAQLARDREQRPNRRATRAHGCKLDFGPLPTLERVDRQRGALVVRH
jgi:hypothetical protein